MLDVAVYAFNQLKTPTVELQMNPNYWPWNSPKKHKVLCSTAAVRNLFNYGSGSIFHIISHLLTRLSSASLAAVI